MHGNAGVLAVAALNKSVDLVKNKTVQAIVTAPISKTHVQKAGFQFPGHTEFFCHAFKVKKFAMMLYHDRLKVVLCTIHVPLKKVFKLLNEDLVIEKLKLLSAELITKFKISEPRIAVCGLNPHAGENGLMGTEEQKIILPAIKKFKRTKLGRSVVIDGPVPSDTVFYNALKGGYDAVLCQYHDQALIPLKTTGFELGVNLTLGLPFVRTSPDHGTAFDIAGQGIADENSMLMALREAVFLTGSRG